jgi:hypothetical protein
MRTHRNRSGGDAAPALVPALLAKLEPSGIVKAIGPRMVDAGCTGDSLPARGLLKAAAAVSRHCNEGTRGGFSERQTMAINRADGSHSRPHNCCIAFGMLPVVTGLTHAQFVTKLPHAGVRMMCPPKKGKKWFGSIPQA